MLLVKLNLIIFQLYELLTKYFNWPVIKFQMFFLKHNCINSFCNTVTCQYLYGPANKAFCCRCRWGMCQPVLEISTLIQTNFFTIPFSQPVSKPGLKIPYPFADPLLKKLCSCHGQPNDQDSQTLPPAFTIFTICRPFPFYLRLKKKISEEDGN